VSDGSTAVAAFRPQDEHQLTETLVAARAQAKAKSTERNPPLQSAQFSAIRFFRSIHHPRFGMSSQRLQSNRMTRQIAPRRGLTQMLSLPIRKGQC